MKNRNFLYDILRDTGSAKFSITKFLALLFSIFLVSYLTYELFFMNQAVDHTLVMELLGIIAGLVGLKNSWGVKSSNKSDMPEVTPLEPKMIDSKSDTNDEGEF